MDGPHAHCSAHAVSDRLLIRLCDELHAQCDVGDELWNSLRAVFTENALMDKARVALPLGEVVGEG